MKQCTSCKEIKALTQFYKDKAKSDGKETRCKTCRKKTINSYHARHPHVRREAGLKFKFGISLEQYNEMLASQNGKCKICERTRDQLSRDMAVDHCHKTGKIRGIICSDCNSGIGLLKDSPIIVAAALRYLK